MKRETLIRREVTALKVNGHHVLPSIGAGPLFSLYLDSEFSACTKSVSPRRGLFRREA